MPDTSLRLQILGPLRLWRGNAELDVGPPQQACVLALLLAREGRPISTGELIDLIWGQDAPASAVNVLHKYIGALRRLLEPTLPVRATGSYLLRRGNGYLLTAGPGTLDLVSFRDFVASAEAALSRRCGESALDDYVAALELWTAPAADGLAQGPAAMGVFAGLNNLFFDTCTAAAELALSLGRPERVLTALQLAAVMAPLHEPLHASLITALGAAGRQGEAIAVFRAVRARLANDLGIDPGRALKAAHQRVLAHCPTDRVMPVAFDVLVGRTDELALLRHAMQPAFGNGSALVIVEGEPGVGKTRLLEEVAAEADQRGALVVWGRGIQGDGTPSMWPWVQAVRVIVDALPPAARKKWLDSDLGRLFEPREGVLAGPALHDSGGQFRLFEHVVGVVGDIATRSPLVLIIDDLHWADITSVQLFSHLVTRLPTGAVVIGALRDRAPPPGTELARMLAAASRVSGHHRVRIGPLDPFEVSELVRRETGRDPDLDAARSIYTRTAGNPFFVRELSRFLANAGPLTAETVRQADVPATVRDVVRDRLADVDDDVKYLLQAAALTGREVGIGLLARVAGVDVHTCLDRLEPLEGLGLLAPVPQDPSALRFAHDIVREAVVGTTPPGRATQLHLRIADALERTEATDDSVTERLAYHLWSAVPLAEPARAVGALVRAGSVAATKSALAAAERHLRSAVQISREAGSAELELPALSQLTAVVGMRSMYGTAALDLLERAEHLARGLGRELEATAFLFSRWTAHGQAIEFDRSGPLARRLLDQGYASADLMMRTYGLQAWGIHQYQMGNVGEAYRYLSQSEESLLAGLAEPEQGPVRGDLESLMLGMLGEISAVHGDVDAARTLLDTLEAAAHDNPYRISVWATMASRAAAVIGDTEWALRAADAGIAVDPGFSFVFLGTYQRLARCWALAVSGSDQSTTIPEAQRLIAANLLDPPRSCVATWYGLLGEMQLAAGAFDAAAAALDRADFYLNTYGQRYPEGLIGLLRARLLLATGAPITAVRSAAEAARVLSVERGARLFATRADDFLASLR
ncbi:BTAD domain-containing putative transcriptional regulator [Mycolicibacterium sp. BiH015]|uniref:BTAD domain-containing putative transcriptional regulator n=1 Tax=Mycolicibacterium sp. BiH015 TaxID=3018808 RepID=UPI0022E3BFB2|nr:BTAD domain-containing putative transcriptional regulator [Mycolicibacterium sp. BiH015]MDA2892132.1 BTAD domain-containing putative transcriptional regulator [Mycolicibacterium sp. BiH015]